MYMRVCFLARLEVKSEAHASVAPQCNLAGFSTLALPTTFSRAYFLARLEAQSEANALVAQQCNFSNFHTLALSKTLARANFWLVSKSRTKQSRQLRCISMRVDLRTLAPPKEHTRAFSLTMSCLESVVRG